MGVYLESVLKWIFFISLNYSFNVTDVAVSTWQVLLIFVSVFVCDIKSSEYKYNQGII